MVNTKKMYPERKTVKLSEVIPPNGRSNIFSLVFSTENGLKKINTKFGEKYLLTFSDNNNEEYTVFLNGKERSHVFGKTVVEVLSGKPKGFQFVLELREGVSKEGRKYKIYSVKGPDEKDGLDDALLKVINKCKTDNLSRDQAIAMGKRVCDNEAEYARFLELYDGKTAQ